MEPPNISRKKIRMFREVYPPKNAFQSLFVKIRLHWWLAGLLFTAILSWVAFPTMIPWKSISLDDFPLNKGSLYDVKSPAMITYHDDAATQREKERVVLDVPLVYNLEKTAQLNDIQQMFAKIRAIRTDINLTDDEKIAFIGRLFNNNLLSKDAYTLIATASDEKIFKIEDSVRMIIDDILDRGIIGGDRLDSFASEISSVLQNKGNWQKTKERLKNGNGRELTDTEVAQEMKIELFQPQVESSKFVFAHKLCDQFEARDVVRERTASLPDTAIRSVVEGICRAFIRPNLSYNARKTGERWKERVDSVASVTNTISKNEIIIRKGEIVTPIHHQKLAAIESSQKSAPITIIAGIASLIAFLFVIFVLYLKQYEKQYERKISNKYRKILALGITFLGAAIAEKLIIAYSLPYPFLYPLLLIPAVITSAMVAILISTQLAVLTTIILAIIVGIMSNVNAGNMFENFILVFGSGIVSVLALSNKVRCRKDVMMAGLYVCIASTFIVIGISLVQNEQLITLAQNSLCGLISGIIVIIAVPGLLPVFEYLAKEPTNIQLLELSDSEHKLLKELEREAPGTYHHSINLSKLAEAAAEAIGSDTLLARVGAYYHDIGKMERPGCFSENQNGSNIHDILESEMSVWIIKGHVANGVARAKKHKLPNVIEDIIAQHHGTTLISYFYDKALAESGGNSVVDESEFRYIGPKPQTKEAAIILLADSVEAASRSITSNGPPTEQELRELVNIIINEKIMDAQLDDSNLTLSDIKKIGESFVQVLYYGIYHSRIAYPKSVEEDNHPISSYIIKAVMTNGRNHST